MVRCLRSRSRCQRQLLARGPRAGAAVFHRADVFKRSRRVACLGEMLVSSDLREDRVRGQQHVVATGVQVLDAAMQRLVGTHDTMDVVKRCRVELFDAIPDGLMVGVGVQRLKLFSELVQVREARPGVPLYAGDCWDDAAKADLDAKNNELEDLLERKQEYVDTHVTVEGIRKHIENWDDFYPELTDDEKKQLLHATIRRIDVDFPTQMATIHWTFSNSTAQINPKIEKTRSHMAAHEKQKHSVNDGSKGSSGTVVEIGGLEPPTSCMPCRRSPS
jgi:hypothetical protein